MNTFIVWVLTQDTGCIECGGKRQFEGVFLTAGRAMDSLQPIRRRKWIHESPNRWWWDNYQVDRIEVHP